MTQDHRQPRLTRSFPKHPRPNLARPRLQWHLQQSLQRHLWWQRFPKCYRLPKIWCPQSLQRQPQPLCRRPPNRRPRHRQLGFVRYMQATPSRQSCRRQLLPPPSPHKHTAFWATAPLAKGRGIAHPIRRHRPPPRRCGCGGKSKSTAAAAAPGQYLHSDCPFWNRVGVIDIYARTAWVKPPGLSGFLGKVKRKAHQ